MRAEAVAGAVQRVLEAVGHDDARPEHEEPLHVLGEARSRPRRGAADDLGADRGHLEEEPDAVVHVEVWAQRSSRRKTTSLLVLYADVVSPLWATIGCCCGKEGFMAFKS